MQKMHAKQRSCQVECFANPVVTYNKTEARILRSKQTACAQGIHISTVLALLTLITKKCQSNEDLNTHAHTHTQLDIKYAV